MTTEAGEVQALNNSGMRISGYSRYESLGIFMRILSETISTSFAWEMLRTASAVTSAGR